MNDAKEPEFPLLSHLSLDCQTEWRSLRMQHHNVLLEGPDAATDAVLSLLQPHLREPIVWKRPRAPLELRDGKEGVLILQAVAALEPEEQIRLLGWLDDARPHTQIVSTTTHSLFPLVARGLFDTDLYYRLNVMLLHVDLSNHLGPHLQPAEG